MAGEMKNKAQITIFIIAAIVIIAIIALFLLLRSDIIPDIGRKPEVNPNAFLDSCLEDKIKEAVELISSQGGHLNNPLNKTFTFNNEAQKDISYLCYNLNNYNPCINQEPMLIQHLKDEVYDYLSGNNPDNTDYVYDCVSNLASSLEKKYESVPVKHTKGDFDVDLRSRKVIVKIDAELTLTKTGETSTHKDFKVIVASRFYDLAIVVQEIVSQEAEYCHFNTIGFMLFNPQFDIDKLETGDLSTIYSVEHRSTKEKFRFAVRSCVMPPGR